MEQLCRRIHMPEEVTQTLLRLGREWGGALPTLGRDGDEAALREALEPDPGGFKELYCMLRAALEIRGEFDRLGIPEPVYWDTMGCFSRFVGEHMDRFGRYGFDRGWWTVRQISCKLFRVGELEYELSSLDGAPAVSLHIPTGARLEPEPLRRSWLQARALLGRVFPAYGDAPIFCRSWLLSPTLKGLLPPWSNILQFQQSFRITPLPIPCGGVMLWVYQNPALPLEELPENTSLQRKLKGYLLQGGTFWDAKGVLCGNPFL